MTPVEAAAAAEALRALQEQQLLTAWIQAGAAVAQAVGAVAAIVVSVRLAQQAAKREIAADHAATARAEAAERAASERATAAEAAALNRAEEAAREVWVGPLRTAAAMIERAEGWARDQQAAYAANNERGTYVGTMAHERLNDAEAALRRALGRDYDIHIVEILQQALDAVTARREYRDIPAEVAVAFGRFAAELATRRTSIEALIAG